MFLLALRSNLKVELQTPHPSPFIIHPSLLPSPLTPYSPVCVTDYLQAGIPIGDEGAAAGDCDALGITRRVAGADDFGIIRVIRIERIVMLRFFTGET